MKARPAPGRDGGEMIEYRYNPEGARWVWSRMPLGVAAEMVSTDPGARIEGGEVFAGRGAFLATDFEFLADDGSEAGE
ncbi:MAG: hypothetical protein U0M51_04355 [Eggerthellaceae bacterium]